MGSFKAKPLPVRVLDADGKDLGLVSMRPTGANWRQTDGAPSVNVGPRDKKRLVRCERVGEEWRIQLQPGEGKPTGVRMTADYLPAGLPA